MALGARGGCAVIRPLRRLHRVAFTLLVVVLPALLVAVLVARPARTPAPAPADPAWSIRIEPGHVVIDRPATTPEVLAYLESDVSVTAPGPGSRFLGALAGSRTTLAMPADAKGQVLLYSPALQRALARQALP